jgi:TonB family protein
VSDPVLEASLRNLAAWSLQVGVLALVAAVLSRLVPIERPHARLAFGQALLVLVFALPLLQPWRSANPDVGWSLALTPLGASASPSSDASSSAVTPAWSAVVAGLLLLGLSVQLTRVGVGLVRIRSLRHRGRAWDPPPPLMALRDELAPRARFLVTDETDTPATCGLRQPVILLPTGFESMDPERQRAIAAHELVHARRGDWLPLVLEEMLKAVLFFHPAVHWLVGRVRLAREQAVDAAVVERLGAREVYLESLVEVARSGLRARAVPAAPFLRESHLRERVDLLLKEVVMSRVRTQLNAGLTAAAILLAVSWAVSAAPLQSAPTPAPARAVDAARFTMLAGVVQVKFAGTHEWIPATRTQVLRADDLVRTGPGATAEIRFADGTLFKVQPDSLVEIDESLAKRVSVGTQSGDEMAGARVPRLVRKANPVYPEGAKADKAEGTFKVEIVVAKDGSVRDARVVASSSTPSPADPARKEAPAATPGDARLAQAALEAVRGWRYEPVLKNGQPVEAKLTVTINFKLS